MEDCDLRNADLSEATLDYTRLPKADLRDAMIDKTTAHETCFQSARMVWADLSHTDATGADFLVSDMTSPFARKQTRLGLQAF